MTAVDIPIPASCAARPTVGGLVAPVINLPLAGGGYDFRSRHQATMDACWKEGLCQVCGQPVGLVAVLFGGPNQVGSGRYTEPPLCVPCAVYASKACPMVAGKQTHYARHEQVSKGQRGKTCPEPGCDCGGWSAGPGVDHFGDPAHDWYAVFIRPAGYTVTVNWEELHCSDGGCRDLHRRLVTNGGQLTDKPFKMLLVSRPGEGRLWQRLPEAQWPGDTCPAIAAHTPTRTED